MTATAIERTEHAHATDASGGSAIGIEDLTVRYGPVVALEGLSLDVARGETVALLGPSGSGKSTALKAVAGFLRPEAGRITLAGRDVTYDPPNRRGIGVVVQNYALFPHMRVAANVAFGLKARRVPRAEVARRVTEALDMVGMANYAKRYPRELSGGQQQRVAIARALAIRPPVLLLDEPLSALDATLRSDLLGELQRLRADLPDVAIMYVTHDQTEALALADRIAVMRDARLVDLDATDRLYRRPPSEFTASFLGAANLLPADVLATCAAEDASVRVAVGGLTVAADPTRAFTEGQRAMLVARPHTLGVAAVDHPNALPARLIATQWRGADYRLTCTLEGAVEQDIRIDVTDVAAVPALGERLGVTLPSTPCVLVPVTAGATA
ncbi:ABC transporter ATP-binding protein [Streptomyces sp. SID3343]|uniref:ABC transporter ATP-binding protein n=1 Tax=Streptomyces sp. SID3343 TaxID=2690260 RepID=UPI00136B4843|nr:ABC transporter ATP-binding protein [Streptomyces sp. SID3343]MYW01391.1 ATP-binding cassette domain-containing protein [Streptomyces sp. SID3343]